VALRHCGQEQSLQSRRGASSRLAVFRSGAEELANPATKICSVPGKRFVPRRAIPLEVFFKKTGGDCVSFIERIWTANAAVKDLRVDKAYARSVQGKARFVSIQIRVSKSLVPAIHGPCWPPSCILEPAPPPPPPSR